MRVARGGAEQPAARGGAGGGDYDEDEDEGEYDEEEEGEGGVEGEEGEEGAYPEPPARGYHLPDLLAVAAEERFAAEAAAQPAGDAAVVYGITGHLDRVADGDMFVCRLSFDLANGPTDGHESAAEAVAAGASCLLADVLQRPLVERLLADLARRRRGGQRQDDDDEEAEGDEYGEAYDDEEEDEEEEDGWREARGSGSGGCGELAGPSGRGTTGPDGLPVGVPGVRVLSGVPVVFVEDVDDFAGKLGAAFYEGPSLDMRTVSVTGTSGKTTTSWLVRGRSKGSKGARGRGGRAGRRCASAPPPTQEHTNTTTHQHTNTINQPTIQSDPGRPGGARAAHGGGRLLGVCGGGGPPRRRRRPVGGGRARPDGGARVRGALPPGALRGARVFWGREDVSC